MIKKTTFLAAMLLTAAGAHANANVPAMAAHDAETVQTREVSRPGQLTPPEYRTAGFFPNNWGNCNWGSFYTRFCGPNTGVFVPRG